MITQVSVFLENTPGALSAMARLLADASINMHVLAVADTAEYGIARIVCDKPKSAHAALEEAGFSVAMTPVCAVELPDTVGALADFLETAYNLGANIAYAYCFVEPTTGNAVNIFRLEDNSFEDQVKASGYRVLTDADFAHIHVK